MNFGEEKICGSRGRCNAHHRMLAFLNFLASVITFEFLGNFKVRGEVFDSYVT